MISENLPVWARRAPVLACAVLTLIAGLLGGWVRFGGPVDIPAHWMTWHGALVAGLFFPTLITLERAVATGHAALWVAVGMLCAADLMAVIGGQMQAALGTAMLAMLLLLAVHLQLVWRFRELHLVIMALAALLAGSGHLHAYAAGHPLAGLAGWGGFLVLTIMAERIELSRVRRPAAPSLWLMGAFCTFMAAGLLTGARDGWSQMTVVLGAAGAWGWLWRWDLARLTWRKPGLPGYVGKNVLAGYAWLAVALISAPYNRDLAIHGVMLGYVFTMVMGHAPVIFPAILRRRLRFSHAFYMPAGLLQASLILRAVADLGKPSLLLPSATLSLIAIVLLFVTTLRHLGPQPVPPPGG